MSEKFNVEAAQMHELFEPQRAHEFFLARAIQKPSPQVRVGLRQRMGDGDGEWCSNLPVHDVGLLCDECKLLTGVVACLLRGKSKSRKWTVE